MSTELLWPEGYQRIVLDEVDSTNDEAARLAPELRYPTWILARRQNAPRGRRGRGWEMPDGSFAATLVMRPTGTAGWAALRSFMTACALFETLALYVDRTRLSLKWPNDALLDGGKVAGILLEAASNRDGIEWLAIGVGVNLAEAPTTTRGAAFPPIGLECAPDPEEFLTRLAGHYATEEAILEQLGFEPIREKWLRHAARLGEQITARCAHGEVTGRFISVDAAGHLVLDTGEGQTRIAAADIYF